MCRGRGRRPATARVRVAGNCNTGRPASQVTQPAGWRYRRVSYMDQRHAACPSRPQAMLEPESQDAAHLRSLLPHAFAILPVRMPPRLPVNHLCTFR